MTSQILKAATISTIALAAFACGGGDGPAATPTERSSTRDSTERTAESPTGGKWRTLAPMPTPRSEVAIVSDGERRILVIGGLEGDGSPSAKVEIYDTETDSWTAGPPLPTSLYDAAAVLAHGTPMVTGGFDNVGDPSNKVFALDYPTGWFEWWRAMPSGRASHAAAVIPCGEFDVGSDCIYLVGGVVEAARSLSVVDMFDFKTQSWVEVPEIPTVRDQLAGTMQDYKVYAIGGRANASGGSLGTTEEYDPETEGWTAKAPMQEARKEMAAAGLDQRRYGDHRIFVFGGESGEGALSIVEAYVPGSDSWVSLSPMPTARHGAGAAVVERTIYVIGGTTADGSVTGANEAFTP